MKKNEKKHYSLSTTRSSSHGNDSALWIQHLTKQIGISGVVGFRLFPVVTSINTGRLSDHVA